MLADSLILTVAGMGSVFAFLAFLSGMMYATSAIFTYIGPEEESESASQDDATAVVAAVAVALKK